MKNLAQAFKTVTNKGGFTFNLNEGLEKQSGFSVAISKEIERYYLFDDEVNFNANLEAFILENSIKLTFNNYCIGAWLNADNGLIYFDVVEIVYDKKEAIKKGFERNQLAIFDLDNSKEIRLSN